MASFQELFDQVVGPLNDPAQFGRQEQVNLLPNQVPTDEQMYQQAAFNDYGGDKSLLRSEIERDLVTLKPHQFIGKYGEEIGSDMLRRKYAQSRRYDYDAAATRGLAQAAGDSLVSAISGFGSTVASPVAALAGFASPELGATMAGAIDEATAYANSLKSDAVQRRVKMQAARTAVREQQNQAQYEKDVASGESELVASLARIGRDAMGGAADVLTDPMQFSELAAQGVGSMAAIPLIGAGIGAGIPTGAATRLIAGAIGPTRTAVKAGRAIEKALPTTTAIGLTEAGGTFVQATNEVMNIPQAEIEKLPAYQERIAARMTPEEARLDMANDAGIQAALMQFPAAIVAGSLVSKFEAAPLARRSVTDVFANLGKETLEEGTQSATSQLAVNQAIKSNVDAKRERSAGVGTQFGVGAVAGFGTAGAIQTPGVIAQGVSDTVGAAKSAVDQRLADLRKANEDASPVSESKVRSETEMLTAESPNIVSMVMDDANYTPEKKTDLVNMVNTISGSILSVNPEELAGDPNIPPVVHEAAKNAPNQVDMLSNLARIAMDTKRPMEDRVSAQGFLAQTLSGIDGYFQAIREDELKDVAEDDVLQNYVSVAERVFASLRSSPAINKALETSNDLMASAVKDTPLTENSTPEQAAIHLAAADLAPETATRESVDTLLKMATKGKLQLNEQQYTNLTMLKKLFDNAAAYDEEMKLAGAKPQDTVSRAIKTDTIGVDGELSALQHAQGIRQALVQGDVEGAKARLEDLGMFAQHMQNKVNAINSHMATKDPTMATAPTYQKLVGTLGNRTFVDSGKPIGVTPTSANSIRQVQLIGAEANFVTNAFNILAETFPQLDIQPMELIELDAQLDGRPEELAAQFTAAKKKVKQQPKAEAKPAPAKAEPAPVAEQQAAPAPVRSQEVTPEFEQTKLTAIRAMTDADLKRHLKTLTNDLMNEDSPRKARVVEMITAEQEARAALARETAEPVQEEAAPEAEPEATGLSGYTNHSGGAKGSDSVWDIVGRSFGLGQSLHYYGEGSKTPLGNTPLTPKQLAEADPALIRANKSLGRHYPPKNAYVRSLLQRNYYQVRNSDAVYAIGNIAGKLVEGGTGWAVQMAIDMAKPVYVFNQKDNLWYTFSNGQFVQTGTPALTKNFAGIGTREITKAGEQAIREVYEKTVSELGKAPAPVAEQQARADLPKATEEDDTPPWDTSEEPATKEEKKPAPAPTKKSAAPLAEEDKKRGFALNAGQKEALRKIKEFLQDTSKKTFSLIGPAGTGKTTIVEEILDGLDPKQFRGGVILSSPTHRANAVTRSKNPEAKILTLHKLLGLKPTTDLENFDAKNVKFEESENGGIPSGSLVIMDESSMINDNLFDFLQDKLRESPGSKIIFLGDSAQLNPVKQSEPSKALTSTSGVAELTTVERAKNAALLDESVSDAFTPEQRANYEEMVESNATIDTTDKSILTPVTDLTTEALQAEFDKLDQLDRRLSRDEIARFQDVADELERREDQVVGAGKSDATVAENPLLSAYSTLIRGASNRFVNTFNLPMNPISKLDGSKTPIRDVLRGLKDTVDDIGAMRAFQAILGDFPSALAHMNNELNRFMTKKTAGKTHMQAFMDGSRDPTIYPNGRTFSIAEFGDNGLTLNTELAAKAYLAAVNWLLNGMSFIQLYDKERAAKVLNISEEEVTDQQMELLNRGVTRLQAIDALANNIQRYWGVTPKADVVDGFTKGVPQAVAANLIDMMLNQDFNGEKTLTETKLNLGINKDLVIYTPVSLNDSGLNNYRDAIEKLVSTTPELVVYMGDAKPPVAKTQMNNPSVLNTPDQIKMIENMNATGYTVNLQTLGVYEALGIDNIIALLGEPNVDKATTNKNTLLSRKGRNTNITNAWKTVQQTLFQMELQAEEDGVPVEQVAIHYAHNVTSVGRAQQLGRYTPQSSKLMRSIFLPTNSKPLNLTDTTGQDWKAFMLSLGQLLGQKVHNFDPDVTEGILFGDDKKPGLLNGKYARVIKVLQDQIQTGRAFSVTELNLFKEVMGKPTFETIQALTDYARFLNTEDKSQYVTQLYLEADGMSNGPFNAMALFTMGDFTPEQLKNLAKCGLYFGGEPELQTTWVQRQKDTVDLYGEVAVGTRDNIKTLTDGAIAQAAEPKGRAGAERYLAMRKHMNRLMGLLLPDTVELNADGDIVSINRNLPKNPSTITNYGSGMQGIADNLTNAMLDSLYARISDALLARSQDPTLTAAQAMFRDDPEADEKLALLDEAMKALTSYSAVVSKKTGYNAFPVKDSIPEQVSISTEYTVSRNAFKVLSNNVRNLVVSPMDSAIQSTIGHTVGVAVNSLRTLTQIQGIILANAYQKRVNELVAKNSAKTLVRGGYLSAKQQKEILESLNPLHPQINTGAQNYFIAGGERANLNDTTPYGESFNGKISALPTVYAPINPGVKGIATMVIGSGDGMTIQLVAADPTNTERTLFVFDGINYALDFIKQGSVAANKAAFNAILGNPMQEVSKTFDAFLAELDGKLDVYTDMSTDMKFQIGQALFGFGFTMEEADALTGDMLINYMEGAAAAARKYALMIQARHNVMSRVNLGMDQMAAAGSPYLVTDKIELVGEPHEIANQLTQLYKEELKRLQEEAAILANDTNISRRKDLQDIGVQTESGAVVLTGDAIRGLVDRIKNKVPRSQQLVLTQAIKNVLADGYKVISGSYDQLMAYNQNLGANGIDTSRIDPDSDQGITLPDRKEIWLLNPDSEVLAHEFVHAATYSILLSYMHSKYGTSKSSVSAEVGASIDAIEQLMNQFMDMKDEILKANPSDEFFTAYMNTRLTIIELMGNKQHSLASRTATAVNEYMAWSLSNQELVKAQSKIPVRLTTILWETLKNIRNWLFGSTTGRNVDDMLSNLAYHTKVVMSASQPSLSAMTKDTSLMMSRVYGHDQRLADLDRTFDQKIADYVTAQGPVQQARRTEEVGWSGINALHMIGLFSGNGFPMTTQEANTFYKVVAALGTQAKLDPAVMNRMQELYAAATRELTVESFMKDPEGNNPADYGQAEKKYEVIMGQRGVGKDPIGRSTLMPTFMALALTNDTFREVLAKLPVPRTEASTQERAFDRLLENQANKMLDQLSDVLSGQKRSANVQQAIDNLAYQLVDAAQQSQGFYDQYVTPLGTLADKANATIVESMGKVADKFTTLAEQRRQAGKDRKLIDSAINNGLEVAASIINEEKAGLLGESILAGANASQSLPKWMHDLIADLVGRVDSNADLYDMIKKVRSSIQRLRNQFRTELPKTLAKQFTRKVAKEEWSTMNAALGKSNLAAVVQNGSFTRTDTLAMLGNQPALNRGIRKLEDEIKALDPKFAKQYLDRAQQLATFMMTGVTGQSLARNARAIVRRLGTNQSTLNFDPALERAVDSLASLYAVNMLSDADKQVMGSLVQSQKTGVEFTFGYALGLHNQEMSRLGDSVNGQAFVNHYKGHMPTLQQDGVSLIIRDDKEFVTLAERSYVRKAPYAQSSLDRSAPQSYYFAPVNGRSNFNQGIVQNVRQTMGGVDSITGYTVGGLTGGRITDPRQVARITAALSSGRYTEKGSNLLPVYENATGNVVAYERSADPTMLQALNYNTNFGEVMGAWKGRLAEETLAVQFNQVSVEYVAEMYRKDTFNNSANKAQYVDLFDTRVHNKYPVIEDALKLFTPSTVAAIHAQFPDGRFWVRKEMLDNVIGFRSATVGDAWTGNTYWSKETQEAIRKTAMLIFGNKAYANFVNAEQTVQGVVQDAKTLIIVKSIVVPMANILSGMLQLVARGVPYRSILAGLPKKLAETRQYVASEKRAIEAEAELHATTDAAKQRRLKVEIQSIRDSYKRMSIWPLIERGELSSMSDDAQPEDQELVSGKLNAFIEAQVNKLPPAIRAAGKYALITKDTALYKGLRKSVEYGDFLVKAILWDDLVNRQGKDVDYANGRITEEFVNFDRLGGRTRQYLESMGLLWFYNFKIRIAKVGLSIIRNNPLHALMAATIPAPSSIGSPITDNVFSLAVEGRLGYSIGLDQLIGAPMMHPLDNMLF